MRAETHGRTYQPARRAASPEAQKPAPGAATVREGPDQRRPAEYSRGIFDKHHFQGVLGTQTLLYKKFIAECRGHSPWWRGGAPQPIAQLVEETGRPERTLRRWMDLLRRPHAGATPEEPWHPYIRTWRFREGLVVLVVERISFELGRGRKADTRRYLDRAFRPDPPSKRKAARLEAERERTNVAGVNGHMWPVTGDREVPHDETGQGLLALGPLGASTENRKQALKSKEAPPGSLRSASGSLRSAPGGAPSSAQPPTEGQSPPGNAHVRSLRRVLAEFPRLSELARRQSIQAGLVAAAGEAKGVGAAALEHGFRCALEAVQRYQDLAGRPGWTLRSSLYAIVLRIVPGEAMRYNSDRAERDHMARKDEDRAAARAFSRRIEQLVEAGTEYGEACDRALGDPSPLEG